MSDLLAAYAEGPSDPAVEDPNAITLLKEDVPMQDIGWISFLLLAPAMVVRNYPGHTILCNRLAAYELSNTGEGLGGVVDGDKYALPLEPGQKVLLHGEFEWKCMLLTDQTYSVVVKKQRNFETSRWDGTSPRDRLSRDRMLFECHGLGGRFHPSQAIIKLTEDEYTLLRDLSERIFRSMTVRVGDPGRNCRQGDHCHGSVSDVPTGSLIRLWNSSPSSSHFAQGHSPFSRRWPQQSASDVWKLYEQAWDALGAGDISFFQKLQGTAT